MWPADVGLSRDQSVGLGDGGQGRDGASDSRRGLWEHRHLLVVGLAGLDASAGAPQESGAPQAGGLCIYPGAGKAHVITTLDTASLGSWTAACAANGGYPVQEALTSLSSTPTARTPHRVGAFKVGSCSGRSMGWR